MQSAQSKKCIIKEENMGMRQQIMSPISLFLLLWVPKVTRSTSPPTLPILPQQLVDTTELYNNRENMTDGKGGGGGLELQLPASDILNELLFY